MNQKKGKEACFILPLLNKSMTNIPIPDNEAKRLQSLDSYHIVDTLPEQAYDDITKIAALICNTPIALISLIHEKKQFFKSGIGLTIRETPREIALCAHAIMQPDELLMVSDLRTDERFSDNPMVTGSPHFVFYAGMPMTTDDGFALGTICVLDSQPKELSIIQQDALKRLARQVIHLMELRKKNDLLAASQHTVSHYAKQMESFAFMASHDLREPLRMIHNFMQLLQNNYAHQLDEKARKYIGFAADGSRRATRLIDDLLSYARQGTEKPPVEAVDLNKLLEEIIHLNEGVISEKKAVVHISSLPVLHGERTPLKTVFQNLISNAIKFQHPNLSPEIFINVEDRLADWLFSISDNGIGISPEHFEVIFDPFRKLHPDEEFSGSGIGLAACKKIIEQQGGIIWVESGFGKGTVFYFTYLKQKN